MLLHIQPGAASTEICGVHGDRLKIRIKAQPQDGEANQAVIEYLSEILKIAKKKIYFIRGESSRQKDILVELNPEEVFIFVRELLQ